MRFDPADIHPRLFRASDRLNSELMAGQLQDPDVRSAFYRHQSVWWKTYGRGFAMGTAAVLAVAISMVVAGKGTGQSWLALGALVPILVGAYLGIQRNKRQLTGPELEALIPALTLDPVEVAYAETLVAVSKSNLAPDERKALMADLSRLLDEEAVLGKQEEALHQVVNKDGFEALDAEAKRLEDKAATAKDEIARESYRKSLDAVRRRLDHQERFSPYMERIEAHRELILQTLKGVRESLGRTHMAPGLVASPDFEILRSVLVQVEQQAESVEKAVAELNSLG